MWRLCCGVNGVGLGKQQPRPVAGDTHTPDPVAAASSLAFSTGGTPGGSRAFASLVARIRYHHVLLLNPDLHQQSLLDIMPHCQLCLVELKLCIAGHLATS